MDWVEEESSGESAGVYGHAVSADGVGGLAIGFCGLEELWCIGHDGGGEMVLPAGGIGCGAALALTTDTSESAQNQPILLYVNIIRLLKYLSSMMQVKKGATCETELRG